MQDISSQNLIKNSQSYKNGKMAETARPVCIEDKVKINFNGRHIAELIVSPGEYEELGAGFVITQGLCSKVESVKVADNHIMVSGIETQKQTSRVMETGGGFVPFKTGKTIVSEITISITEIFEIISSIVSELWEKTGGAHCSVLFSNGKLIAKSSDVGRHNTVDKVVGRAVLDKIMLDKCILGCTGRQPEGMIAKAVNAEIPIVVTKAASTDKGIDLAIKSGLTLIARVRQDSFEVYSNAQRVKGLA